MKLSPKGWFSTRATLPEHAENVAKELASWPDMHARTHWLLGDETEVDGADFYLGEEELGHLHRDGQAHVATGPRLRKVLVAGKLASPFRWSSQFVVDEIGRGADVAHALWLFRLSYDRARAVPDEHLVARVEAYAVERERD